MKFLTRQTCLLTLGLTTALTTMAQQKSNASFQKTLDESNKSLITVKNKQDQKELKKVTDRIAPLFQRSTDEMAAATIKQLTKDAAETEKNMKAMELQYPLKKTDFDMPADINLAPFPITDLVLAGKTNVEAVYESYFSKLELRKKQLTELAKKNDKYQEVYDKEGKAGLEKRAAAEADRNALIQQMGGVEKLKNMTDAERKAAAEQMKAKIQQDPTIVSGGSRDAGMKTMQQKLMADPEYAKRFNKMSEDEKQAEIRKYMTIKPAERKPGVEYTSNPQTKNTDVEKSIEISQLQMRSQKRMEEVVTTYNRMTTEMNNTIEAMKSQLNEWASKTVKDIPVVELGEYGHDKDPELMHAMEITRKYAWYYITMQEVKMRTICWQQYKTGTRAAMMEFNSYAADYKWGQGKESQLFNGTLNDPKIAGSIAGYYGTMEDLANLSKDITNDSKNAQKELEKAL